MKDLFVSLIVAFSMYSKIPMPHIMWSDKSMRYAMCFFPWVGAAVGIAEYLWFLLCQWIGLGSFFFAAVAVVLPILITGGIHFDGFLDTSDAMSSWREREARLRILKDSHVGAFAVISAVVFFVIALGAATEINAATAAPLCLMFGITRSFSALSVVGFPHANPTGTAAAFGDSAVKKAVQISAAIYILLLAAAALLTDPLSGILIIVSVLLVFAYYHHMAMKYFGGMTGDLAGYFVSLAELVTLVSVVIGNAIMRNLL